MTASSSQLQQLYVAYFGRAADPTGLDYWETKGITTAKFAADMYAQAEFQDAYGSLSTESQVNQIYQNLFDRDADAAGLLYWTKQIDLGVLKLAEIANDLIWAAENNAGSEDDKTALENKTAAATAYTAKVKETTSAILAYQAESTSPWVSGDNIAEAVSYMSGIDKDTASTTAGIAASVTTITNNGVPSLSKNYSLTSGVDDIDGTAGTNKFQAGLTTSGANTLNSLDELDGKAGTDTLNASIATSVTPGSIKNIENLNLTFEGQTKTFNATNLTGVTTLTDIGSTYLGITSNLGSTSTDLVVSDNDVGATFTYKASAVTGTADSLNLKFANATGNAVTTITGAIETLNVTSSTSANAVRLESDATTLNISGSADFSLLAASTVLNLTTVVDASAATGDITLAHDHTGSSAVTITGGSGNDALTLTGGTTATDTVSGGAGDDTITFTADLADADVIDGGTGTNTLIGLDANLRGLTTANNISNIDVIQFSDLLNDSTLTVANIDSAIKSVTLAGAHTGIVTFGAGTNTLKMTAALTTSTAAALTVNDTGLATDDVLNLTMVNTLDVFAGAAIAINGFETVNINTGTYATDDQDIDTLNITGDPDSAGERVDVTLVVTGSSDLDIDGTVTLGTDGSGEGTIDASAFTGDLELAVAVAGVSTITGGSGNDTFTADAVASTLTGGAGDDAITGGSKSDIINGGAGNDTLTLTALTTGADIDTINGGAGNDTFATTDANLAATHVLDGGAGTDSISLSDIGAVADSQFANKTSIETITSSGSTGLSATLDSNAQAMGVTSVTFAGTNGTSGIDDIVTIQNDVTNAITVTLDNLETGGEDTNHVIGTTYTGVLTINTTSLSSLSYASNNDATLTGGTGTSDTLNFHGGTLDATMLGDVTAIENWVLTDDTSSSLTLAQANIADGKSLVIDGRAGISSATTFAVVGTSETDGALTVHGVTGVDTITATLSDLGDTLYGYAGADFFRFQSANLTTLDTVDGGAGTDTVDMRTAAATLADADFTNFSNVEALTFTTIASTDTDLGAQYVEAGFNTITLAATVSNDLNLDNVTTAQTLNLVAATDTIDASSMTAALTLKAATASITSADTITAGTGTSDVLDLNWTSGATGYDNVTGFETIKSRNDEAFAITTVDGNVASTKSLTIDLSALATTASGTINIEAETNGAVTILAGAAGTTATLSVSSMGDTVTGAAGVEALTIQDDQLTSADTLSGGGGTDTLTIKGNGVLSDSDFTNVSSFETLILGGSADQANTYVLGAEYAGAGFSTITTKAGNDTITLGSGVTTAQTITFETGTDSINAEAASGAITVNVTTETDLTGDDTLTGGTGTDILNITFAGSGTVTAAEMGGVTKFEKITSATNAIGSLALADANNATSEITVDVTNNTTAAFTLTAAAEDDGNIVYLGGGGIDTVTGTAKNDTITLGAGADIFNGSQGSDTISGGAGADAYKYTAVNQSTGTTRDSISDYKTVGADTFTFTINNSTSSTGSTYDATIKTAQAGTANIQSNLSGNIGEVFYDTTNSRLIVNANADNLVSTLDYQIDVNAASTAANTIVEGDVNFIISGGSGEDTITTGDGADTINTGNGGGTVTSGGGADIITGGTGADIINSGAGVDVIVNAAGGGTVTAGAGADDITLGTGADITKYTATTAALMATESGAGGTGTYDMTVGTYGDEINTHTSTTDSIHFDADLLTNADGTETDTLASIGAGATVHAVDRFIELTAHIDGTTADAIVKLDALITTQVAIGDSFIAALQTTTDTYLYLVEQVSTANTIAAQDITLIGQMKGIADVGNTDFATY